MDITLAGSALARVWSDAELQGISIQLSAFDGEIGNSTIPVPDPTGADEVPPGRAVVVEEGSTLLLSGIIVQEGRSRGFEPTNPNKADAYSVDDPNTFLFGFRVTDWIRPEETDYARIAAFFADFLPGVTTTQVLNTSTTTMVAKTYNSDGVADIMRDAIDITGKTLFLHDLAAGGICAHWHALTAGHTCGLTIDDTDPSVNGPTSWLPQNPSRVKDGHDLTNNYSAYGADGIGPIVVSDGTSISTYDVDGKSHQAFANFPEATDLTTLAADAQRLLDTNKDPRDTWTCTIGPLDETALALIRVGDIITCTSTVMTLTASPQRIASLRLSVAGGQRVAPTLWMAELTLGAPVRGPGGRPSGMVRPPSTSPPPPGAGSTFDPPTTCFSDFFNRTVAAPGWGNDWGFSTTGSNADPSVSSGAGRVDLSTVLGGSPDITLTHVLPSQTDFHATMRFSFDVVPSGTRAGSVTFTCYEDPGTVIRFSVQAIVNNDDPGTGQFSINTSTSGSTAVLVDTWEAGTIYSMHIDYRAGTVSATLGSTYIHHDDGAFTGAVDGLRVGASYGGSASTWQLAVESIVLDNCAPSAGQTIGVPEFVATSDGLTDTYNSNFAYQPGSLEVMVDGLPWVAGGYHETDPANGEFVFDQIPLTGDAIRVTYMAA